MCFESFSVPTFVHKPYRILTSFNRTQKKISNRSPFPLAHNFPSPSSLETRQREIGTHMDKDIWTLDKGQIALLLCSGMDGLGIQLLDEKGEEKLRGWGKVVQKDAAKPNDGDIICQNKLFDMPAHRSESAWPSAHHPNPHPLPIPHPLSHTFTHLCACGKQQQPLDCPPLTGPMFIIIIASREPKS